MTADLSLLFCLAQQFFASVTFSIGTPGLVNQAGHGLAVGTEVKFAGTVPAELTVGTSYYVVAPVANSYSVATTPGGTPINFAGVGGAATVAAQGSNDWIDWKVAQNLGDGVPPVLEILITTTFAGGTSVQFQLCAVDSAGANPEILDSTHAIPIADLTAAGASVPPSPYGTVWHLRMSPKKGLPGATKSYLRVKVVPVVGTFTAGAITAHLVPQALTASPLKAYVAP